MNINYNTSLKGEYTFYDKNMNILCEVKNLITDWGMRRLVGDRSEGSPHPEDTDGSQLAFVNNIRHILLGTGSTGYGSESYTDFELGNAIATTEYLESNDTFTTGTTLESAGNNLVFIFTRVTRFDMAASFDPIASPTSTYTINEVGCNWTTTAAQQNNRYGLFSRATLPSPITVNPSDTIFVKYQLKIVTDCDKIITNMHRVNGTAAVDLPNNKTNIRELPFFTLQSDGEPSDTIQNHSTRSQEEFVYPLFEDFNLNTVVHNGTGIGGDGRLKTGDGQDNTFGTNTSNSQAKKIWWLQFYSASTGSTVGADDPLTRYSTFTSTTTSNLGMLSNISVSSYSTAWNSAQSTYSNVVGSNLRLSTVWPMWMGRKKAESVETIKDGNTWSTRISFLLAPNELLPNITFQKLYPATLGDWNRNVYYCSNSICSSQAPGGFIYFDYNANLNYGIVTVFENEYTPNQDNFEGITYSFRFSRI